MAGRLPEELTNNDSNNYNSNNQTSHHTPPTEIQISINTILKLNVGGYRFETTKATVMTSVFFSSLLSGRHPCLKDDHGAYFIDRNGEYFAPILYYMRTRHLIIPANINIEALLHESEYYLLENMSNELRHVIYPPKRKMPPGVLKSGAYCNKRDSKLFIFDEERGLLQISAKDNCALKNAKAMWDIEGVPSIWGANIACKDIYAKFFNDHVKKGRYQIENKFITLSLHAKDIGSGMTKSIATLSPDCKVLYILEHNDGGVPEFEDYFFHTFERRDQKVSFNGDDDIGIEDGNN